MIEVKADRFNRSLDLLQRWLDTQFTQDALIRGAKNLAAEIQNRVQSNETKADGSAWGGYSTKPILVGAKSFETKKAWEDVFKQAKKAGKDSPLHWVTINRGGKTYKLIILPGGYKEVRRLEGHENSKKNFSRTGMMWREFDFKGSQKNVAFIGGKTRDSQNKINWNTDREGINIIAASEKETEKLAKYVNAVVQKKIKEFFK